MTRFVETVIRKEPYDCDRRLGELKLDRPRLLKVRLIALTAGANTDLFHPANAAGTMQYQYGTWALRSEFIDKQNWKLDRPGGVEVIANEALKLYVAFVNVDVACVDDYDPKPRSRKGSGAARVCQHNLFGDLPRFAVEIPRDWKSYYAMVAENGAAELSHCMVVNGTFTNYIERIYLSDGSDWELSRRSLDLEGDVAEDFDPQVIRKK
jgi:hypothetical protein